MVTVSLCMIVRNEENTLYRCLESVRGLFDEIVIVDTGSGDRTRDIACFYTDKVYDFPWVNDFSRARNFSFSKATMDYCMWLDADDIVLPEDAAALKSFIGGLSFDVDVVMMKYHASLDERDNPTYSYYRERIIKRSLPVRWSGAVCESIRPTGNIVYVDIAICNKKTLSEDGIKNVYIHKNSSSQSEVLNPTDIFYYGRELFFHKQYTQAIDKFSDFLSNPNGPLEGKLEACRLLAQCYYRLDDPCAALSALLKSLELDAPHAEICCDLGKAFFNMEQYHTAIYWYETAASCKKDKTLGAFVIPDCYDLIPYLRLCLCHYYLGNTERAVMYNELAGAIRPDNSSYLLNREFFRFGLTHAEELL